eukprot:CAMPEP_0184322868 /NCGR_PEP_ID=MMETSP1049-20130417/127036_1 /TAXON_ID=77928 /ORGANISM="Proteomonas sulcata, Strain CCMP704" /LENGTH=60 /DNA_ID=CAMNT_0026644153 /DNA_START=101 /DNA_END=283 /DNA_ORIENTATION=-
MGAGASSIGFKEPPPWREKGTPEEEKARKAAFESARKKHYAGVATEAGMGKKGTTPRGDR